MEHNVQTVKSTIKALGSNKTNFNVIQKRTSADPAFRQINENFCKVTNTLIRAHKPKVPNAINEINIMVQDILTANPFGVYIPGRQFKKFSKMKRTLLASCDLDSIHSWIHKNKTKYVLELGQ